MKFDLSRNSAQRIWLGSMAALSFTAALGTSGSAVAAENEDSVQLGKVVVTARNREEIAQDVPLPVQVIGGDQLERDDVVSIWDLPDKAPNLQMNPDGENARKVSASIRGVGRNGANDSAEGSVGTIVDGVTLYYSGQAWADYVDLDRIEVLRGPQGTLMGKNTTLGAINIVTKAPSFTRASSFEVSTGDFNTLNGKFSTTGPLIDDLLAFRGTFVVDRANGLYTNTYQSFGHAKETWNEKNRIAGRLQFLLTPSENITDRIIIDKLRSDERVNLGFAWDNGPTTYADGTPRPTVTAPAGYTGSYVNYGFLGKFASRATWFHTGANTIYQPTLGTTDFANSEARPQITNQYGISNQLTWTVPGHTLTSITAYRYQDFDIKNGGTYGPFYVSNSGQQLWNKQTSQELRLISDPGTLVDYQVGAYYLNANVYSDDPSYYGPDYGAWNATDAQYTRLIASAAGRELMRASRDGIYTSSVTDAKVRSQAIYGQADWHLTDTINLTTGVRETWEHKTNRLRQELDRPGADLDLLAAELGVASTAQILADAKAIRGTVQTNVYDWREGRPINDTMTAWNVGANMKFTKDVLGYVSVGQGVKSGFIYFSGGTDTTILPEKAVDYELGVKTLLLNRTLQLNVNLYQTNVTDYQTSWTRYDVDGTTPISTWGNAPKVVARGLEFESAYQFTRKFRLTANGAYNEATYENEWLTTVPEIVATIRVDRRGEQIKGVPKISGAVAANYETDIGKYSARFTLNNAYRSGVYTNDNHAAFTYQPAYVLTNLGVGLGSPDRKWELSVLVRNLFDKFYATSRGVWSATGASSLTQGPPRTINVTLRYKI